MQSIEKVLYTAHTRTLGGRDGIARSDDGRLDLRFSPPGAPGRASRSTRPSIRQRSRG